MIFNINLTRGQMRFLTCVARVTCLVPIKNDISAEHNYVTIKHDNIFGQNTQNN